MQELWENMNANICNDFKVAVIYVAIEKKENTHKEVKKIEMTKFHWKQTANKEIEAT